MQRLALSRMDIYILLVPVLISMLITSYHFLIGENFNFMVYHLGLHQSLWNIAICTHWELH